MKTTLTLISLLTLLLLNPTSSRADELSELKAQLSALMQRVAELESSSTTAPERARVRSPKGAEFDLGGELEFEFVDTEGKDGKFGVDTFYLYPKAHFPEWDLTMKADVAFKHSSAYVEEVHARFSGLPHDHWIEVGLNDMFIANIDRKTEAEILIETAFYRSDDLGIQFGGDPNDHFYWRGSLSNGLKLGTKGPGEGSSHSLIHGARNTSGSGNLMAGLGLGFKANLGTNSKLDLMPFYYNGQLSDGDVSFLHDIAGYDDSSMNDDIRRFGANVRLDVSKFTLIGQYLDAEDGDLDRTGWFVQPSFKLTADRKWFNGVEFVYRYSDLDVDLDNVVEDSLTWDRQQHVVGIITDICKRVKLKTEYFINQEDTGKSDFDDDELLVQFELKF